MVDFAYCETCRHRFILDYFGDRVSMKEYRGGDGCGACDNCRGVAAGRVRAA